MKIARSFAGVGLGGVATPFRTRSSWRLILRLLQALNPSEIYMQISDSIEGTSPGDRVLYRKY